MKKAINQHRLVTLKALWQSKFLLRLYGSDEGIAAMPRPAPEKQAFMWTATAVTGLCVVLLFAVVATGRFTPSAKIPNTMVSADETVLGSRYGGRIAAVLRKPVAVQYVAPPLKLRNCSPWVFRKDLRVVFFANLAS
ncbi:MAG: hypothetical protein O3C34_04090, partial [Proteobacteria bacterium]|nr:hypothetical protein [Pseudomonadota bacterium]